MGYTTEFTGRFDLDKPLTPEHAAELAKYDRDEWPDPPTRGYNQWRITEDGTGVEWDQEEKFYDWKEWLQYMIDKVLAPRGYTLTGSVEWSGESRADVGLLVIEKGKAKRRPLPAKPFAEHDKSSQQTVIEALEEALRDADHSDVPAFMSAMAALGHPMTSDREPMDP